MKRRMTGLRDFVGRKKNEMEKEDEKRDNAADAGVWDGGLGKRG